MKKFLRIVFLWIPLALIAGSVIWVAAYRNGAVRLTPLMVKRSFQGYETKRTWVGINDISPSMVRAVIASEDGRFMEHRGFDFKEMEIMRAEHIEQGKPLRGCSTISQQTAKNCFTWCSDTWIRKGIEAWYTFLIERMWSKKRIMEVYLNVAEMGPGIYGIQTAAQEYFKKDAIKLTKADAITLTIRLPNPLKRSIDWAQKQTKRRQTISKRIEQTPYPKWE